MHLKFGSLLCLVLFSFNISARTIEFERFCRGAGLRQCHFKSTQTPSLNAWNTGLSIFGTIMQTPSRIHLSREQFTRESVKELIELTGATGIAEFVESLPWEDLYINDQEIFLVNSKAASINVRGLGIEASRYSTIADLSSKTFKTRGLSIKTELLGAQRIHKIDMSRPGKVSLLTDRMKITNIPLGFLASREMRRFTPSASTFSINRLVNAITEVMFEEGYEWYKIIDIRIESEQIRKLEELTFKDIPTNLFTNAIRLALREAQTFTIGGPTAAPMRIIMERDINCSMYFENIPILGSITATLDFKRKFGIKSAKRSGNIVTANVEGITTTIGAVKSIVLEGSNLKLKIGRFLIPLNNKPAKAGNSNGIKLTDVKCLVRQ